MNEGKKKKKRKKIIMTLTKLKKIKLCNNLIIQGIKSPLIIHLYTKEMGSNIVWNVEKYVGVTNA